MSRRYLRAIDRQLVAMGEQPEPPRDERDAKRLRLLRELKEAGDKRRERQQRAAKLRQKIMDDHPEVEKWYWPEVE